MFNRCRFFCGEIIEKARQNPYTTYGLISGAALIISTNFWIFDDEGMDGGDSPEIGRKTIFSIGQTEGYAFLLGAVGFLYDKLRHVNRHLLTEKTALQDPQIKDSSQDETKLITASTRARYFFDNAGTRIRLNPFTVLGILTGINLAFSSNFWIYKSGSMDGESSNPQVALKMFYLLLQSNGYISLATELGALIDRLRDVDLPSLINRIPVRGYQATSTEPEEPTLESPAQDDTENQETLSVVQSL